MTTQLQAIGGAMKAAAIAVLALVGCSSSSSGSRSASPSLDGPWIYAAANDTGQGITFTADGTYAYSVLVVTDPTTLEAQEETGTFTVSGSTITFTPTKWSCPGPDAVYTASYAFQGSDLELAKPSGIVVLQPDTVAAQSISVTLGCFDAAGKFTPEPLAAVSN